MMYQSHREEPHRVALRIVDARGMSLLEMLIVVAIVSLLLAVAIPMTGNALAGFRLSGDTRSVSNAVAVAKMRAASAFSRTRLYVDLSARTFHSETWNTVTSSWTIEGGNTSLSPAVSFSFGPVTTPPPSTQPAIGQAPVCTDNTGLPIANTACVMFNSRGVPVDAVFAPTALDAIYLTDGTAVQAVSVAATGMLKTWSTPPVAAPTWVRN
jgi:prepilin-type N-terminal cleavage/methylation domain-containing protein